MPSKFQIKIFNEFSSEAEKFVPVYTGVNPSNPIMDALRKFLRK